MFDMNDAQPQHSSELIPDGEYAKVTMTIRPGGVDGEAETDKGLLKPSNQPGSDVLMLDCEFTVLEGPYARRKFWQLLTVAGGKRDENGVSIGWKITKSIIRAMIDSRYGLNPRDMSEEARQRRILRGLADLSGITFIARIKIEPSSNPAYGDQNRLDRVILPDEDEWKSVMNGIEVPARPSHARPRPASPAPVMQQQSWSLGAAPARTQQPVQPAPAAAPSASGPAWLND